MEINKWINSEQVSDVDKKKLKEMSLIQKEKAFGEPLEFGTAGIRRPMGLGTSLLNKYVIKMIAFAWIKSLEKNFPERLKKGLIIAHDSRNNGVEFSKIVAQVISGMGYKAIMYYKNGIEPTPIVSFTIRDLKLGGGACITASHNPPIFNGFKCFASEGQHLMPYESSLIAKELKRIDINTNIPSSEKNISFLNKTYESYYLKTIMDIIKINKNLKKDLKIVFSPQHGASYKLGPEILRKTGFKVYEVEKQSIPNGDFPNTPDPNPENPLAFNEMIHLGQKINSELLLTTDPDSDRVAVGALHRGEYYLFNGHEMAAILVYYFLKKMSEKNILKTDDYIIKTVVTTSLVDEIAKSFSVKIKNALTGFKYIGELIRKSKKPPIIATEESYGSSLCPTISLDKDALQLLPVIAEVATEYHHKNMTLVDVLHEIYNKYGWYIQKNEKVELKGKDSKQKLLNLIEKISKLSFLGGLKVSKKEDFRNGYKKFDKTNLVILHFEEGSWIAIRPSGTEPLIRKYYCIKGKDKKEVSHKYEKIKKEFNKIEQRST